IFERLHVRTLDDPARLERQLNGAQLFGTENRLGDGNGHGECTAYAICGAKTRSARRQSITDWRPSRRGTRATNPISSAAFAVLPTRCVTNICSSRYSGRSGERVNSSSRCTSSLIVVFTPMPTL